MAFVLRYLLFFKSIFFFFLSLFLRVGVDSVGFLTDFCRNAVGEFILVKRLIGSRLSR
jgi:hypothetical protein